MDMNMDGRSLLFFFLLCSYVCAERERERETFAIGGKYNVCKYTDVFCAPAPDNSSYTTVAGIDLNHGDIARFLPEELGLLTDLALFHLNSNRFCGTVPKSFKKLKLLFKLDLSNNCFAGKFPYVVLKLPSLKYLDLRFNEFEGIVPKELFDRPLDMIFINHSRFQFELPDNFGNSPVSVIVLANNKFRGCLPASLGNMSGTLNQIIFMQNGLKSCLPVEIRLLTNLTVFDVSYNELLGPLPEAIGNMVSLEQLNVRLAGMLRVPEKLRDDSVERLERSTKFKSKSKSRSRDRPDLRRLVSVPLKPETQHGGFGGADLAVIKGRQTPVPPLLLFHNWVN